MLPHLWLSTNSFWKFTDLDGFSPLSFSDLKARMPTNEERSIAIENGNVLLTPPLEFKGSVEKQRVYIFEEELGLR